MELIYDRTLADVQRVATLQAKGWEDMTSDERAYWLRGDPVRLYVLDGPLETLDGPLQCRNGIIKGAYNAVDLNRVEAAAAYLSGLLEQYGYLVPYVPRSSEWAVNDIPTQSDMARYLRNIHRLAENYAVLTTTPDLPDSMNKLTHVGANSIEKVLLDIETLVTAMSGIFLRAGVDEAGVGFYFAS